MKARHNFYSLVYRINNKRSLLEIMYHEHTVNEKKKKQLPEVGIVFPSKDYGRMPLCYVAISALELHLSTVVIFGDSANFQ